MSFSFCVSSALVACTAVTAVHRANTAYLIQQQHLDAAAAQQGSRNGDALALAARQLRALLAHHRLVPGLALVNELRGVRLIGRRRNVRLWLVSTAGN